MGVDVGEIQEHMEEAASEKSKWHAIYIAFLALLLAICGLGGGNNGEEMMTSVIEMSNTYNYFQAKNVRQTMYKVNADQLGLMLVAQPDMPADARAAIEAKIADYKKTVLRYETDPEGMDGKKELLDQARTLQAQHQYTVKVDPYFDFAETMLQIAIVLMSIYLITGLASIMMISYGAGTLGGLLLLDAYTLFFEVPSF